MNDYEARKEERIERYREHAENARRRSGEAYARSDAAVGHIPLGQPILVGHHSEGKHRNAIKRAHRAMDKSCEEQRKAEYWERRAKAAEDNRAISSQDPEALDKLREKLAGMEKLQETMKAANRAIRKGDDDALSALGISDARIALLKKPDFCGRTGFPSYALQNNNGNMRRVRQRIEQLEAEAVRTPEEDAEINGVRIAENTERMGLELYFPGKPCEANRAKLKMHGWKWARRSGCWYRKRSDFARQIAEEVAREYKPEGN